MNFINDDIKINFPVSKPIKNLMEICEKYDREDNYPLYNNMAVSLTDNLAKEAYVVGGITKEQWETIERRYTL